MRKKNFSPEFRSHSTGARKFQKKNSKKIQKIKKPLTDVIFIQNGMTKGRERERKILDLNSVHTRPVDGNSEKNS